MAVGGTWEPRPPPASRLWRPASLLRAGLQCYKAVKPSTKAQSKRSKPLLVLPTRAQEGVTLSQLAVFTLLPSRAYGCAALKRAQAIYARTYHTVETQCRPLAPRSYTCRQCFAGSGPPARRCETTAVDDSRLATRSRGSPRPPKILLSRVPSLAHARATCTGLTSCASSSTPPCSLPLLSPKS